MYALVALGESPSAPVEISPVVRQIISDFSDILPAELPDELPPIRDIQHVIDFASGFSLSNLSHYRMNPTEHTELSRQVNELLWKGFIRELKSLCCTHVTHTKRKMAAGGCVWTIGPSIGSLSRTSSPSLNSMTN